jgi:hypothetical protein
LHHLAALRQPLRLVVRRSGLVAFGVRQLQLDQTSAYRQLHLRTHEGACAQSLGKVQPHEETALSRR